MNNLIVRKQRLWGIIYYVLLVGTFVFLSLFLRARVWCLLDSDMSSEMILAKQLNEEHAVFAKGWYYATELRLLYMPQVFRILFCFTDYWHFVRVYSTIIIYGILLVSACFLAKKLKLGQTWTVLGIAVLTPLSMVYGEYVLICPYYVPCIAISFAALAMVLKYEDSKADMRIRVAIPSACLAFASSLIGPRQIVMFYFPAMISAALILLSDIISKRKNIKESIFSPLFTISSINILSAGIAYLINLFILPEMYYYVHWTQIKLVGFSLRRSLNALGGLVNILGFRREFSAVGVVTDICVIAVVAAYLFFMAFALINRSKISHGYYLISLYSVCAIMVFVLLYGLTDMVYYDLYGVPIAIFAFPVILTGIHELVDSPICASILPLILSGLMILTGSFNYSEMSAIDKTSEQREVAAFLTENGYYNGYATFWNANVLTELSNGQIDVYSWDNSMMMPYVENVNDIHKWLQKTSHSTEIPRGKIFNIYSYDDIYNCRWKDKLRDEDILMETKNLVVYGYGSYEEMNNMFSDQ